MMSSPLPGSKNTSSPGQAALPTIAGAATTGASQPARTTLPRSPTRAIHVTFARMARLLLRVVGDARHWLDQEGPAHRIRWPPCRLRRDTRSRLSRAFVAGEELGP